MRSANARHVPLTGAQTGCFADDRATGAPTSLAAAPTRANCGFPLGSARIGSAPLERCDSPGPSILEVVPMLGDLQVHSHSARKTYACSLDLKGNAQPRNENPSLRVTCWEEHTRELGAIVTRNKHSVGADEIRMF